MRTPTAGQHQHTGIAGLHRFYVVMELPHRLRVIQLFPILLWAPHHVVFADTTPLKAGISRWRIAEVVYLVSRLPQFCHHLWIILVAPTARHLNLPFHHLITDFKIPGIKWSSEFQWYTFHYHSFSLLYIL